MHVPIIAVQITRRDQARGWNVNHDRVAYLGDVFAHVHEFVLFFKFVCLFVKKKIVVAKYPKYQQHLFCNIAVNVADLPFVCNCFSLYNKVSNEYQ